MKPWRLAEDELINTPIELGVVYEARYAISPGALALSLEQLKAQLEEKLPLHIRYLGPSPADPQDLLSVIFVPWDYPTPSPDLTEQENKSVAYFVLLLGREIKKHCRQGIVPTLAYRADVWVHPSEEAPEPVPEPPPSLVPSPHLPNLDAVLDVLKWLGVAGATVLGFRLFRVKGAVLSGIAAAFLLRPSQVADFEKALKENAALVFAAGLGTAILFSQSRLGRAKG